MSKPHEKRAGAKRAALPKRQPVPATRFVLCESGHGFWIVSERNGRVTGIFPVRTANPQLALRERQRRAAAALSRGQAKELRR